MYNLHDTICAVSTPPGEGALAIIRLSGQQSEKILKQIFKGGNLEDRRAVFGIVTDIEGNHLDDVVVIFYAGPKSYTGESMAEIICHGGYVVSQQIQSLLCQLGARPAGPGEFTLRAFLGGRLDLTEAEAVNSVIRAKTSRSKRQALFNLEGKLRKKLDIVEKKIFELITVLEAEINFNDDEINKTSTKEIQRKLSDIEENLDELLVTYDIGRIAEGRAQVAIVGAPNVGKSSLFNTLLKSKRAIVTEIPGTTRDYLSEYVNIGGYPVILTDTAGVRMSAEAVELIGINKAKEIVSDVDLCLLVLDASRPISDEDIEIAKHLKNQRYLPVLNKIDLFRDNHYPLPKIFAQCRPLHISALKGIGIDELLNEVQTKLIGAASDPVEGALLSQRQHDCALNAKKSINDAAEALAKNEHMEIVISIIRESLDDIGELTGKITSEDILNQIFGQFCIGK